MKLRIFLMIAVMFTASAIQAQNIGGDFTVRGASGCFSTILDTVAQDETDTVRTPLNPHRNSVGFELELTKVSGTSIDSAVVDIYGTKLSGGNSGWMLLNSFKMEDSTSTQYRGYDVNSGRGNTYTGYMFVQRSLCVECTHTVSWRVHCLIR
jgi:hypothetical protein